MAMCGYGCGSVWHSHADHPYQVSFDGKLLAMCDRTGLMFKVTQLGEMKARLGLRVKVRVKVTVTSDSESEGKGESGSESE